MKPIYNGMWRIEVHPASPDSPVATVWYSDQQVTITEGIDEKGRMVLEIYREDTKSEAMVYKSNKPTGNNPKGRLYFIGDKKAQTRRIKDIIDTCFKWAEPSWDRRKIAQPASMNAIVAV